MSATIEINALSSGTASGKYEVNSNIVTGLSGVGDCSAGTPGKYRLLRQGQGPQVLTVSAGGDASSPQCDQKTVDIVDNNVEVEPSSADPKTENCLSSEEVGSDGNHDDDEPCNSQSEETGENLLEVRGNSAEDHQPSDEDVQKVDDTSCQDANIDINLNSSSNQAYLSPEFDSGTGNVEPDSCPEPHETLPSVASVKDTVTDVADKQDNSTAQNDLSPSKEAEQVETVAVKLKSKKKVGILQAVHIHLPKFGMKRGQTSSKGRESSTSSDPESSPEKKSRKKKKKDKHVKKSLTEDEKQDDGDVAMVNDDHDDDETLQVEEGCQTFDLEEDEELPLSVGNDETQGSDKDVDHGGHPNDPLTQTPEESISLEGQTKGLDEETEENGSGADADPVKDEDVAGIDAVAMVTKEDEDDATVDECRMKSEITSASSPGHADNEPSSIPNSSLASAEDSSTLPQSSISISTYPESSDVSADLQEDTSTTRQGDCSTLGEVESIPETSTIAYQEAEGNSSPAVEIDGVVPKPDVIPAVETPGEVDPSSEKPGAEDSEQHQEPPVLSSSNQSSFDTDSPSLADTPEHSPKKKSKRRVPLLNVSLPSFGKKHHRAAKSPEQSSDSDRSGSPSKRFPWKKKSPKKVASPVSIGSGSTGEETANDVDEAPVEMTCIATEEAETEHHLDASASKVADAAVAVDLEVSMDQEEKPEVSREALAEVVEEEQECDNPSEKTEDKSGSGEEEHTRAVSFKVDNVAQEGDLSAGEEDLKVTASDGILEVETASCDSLPDAEVGLQDVEQPLEETGHGRESTNIDVGFSNPIPDVQHLSHDGIVSDGRASEQEELEDRKSSPTEDDNFDIQHDETIPWVKPEGRIQMSASLEVHASPTHHISSPADFIMTDSSMEVEDDFEGGDVQIQEAVPGDVSSELTAAEKILRECNELVADDSVGDVQFTPEMLTEFTKTIDAFEEDENVDQDGGDGEERDQEELLMDTGINGKDVELDVQGGFEAEEEGPVVDLSTEALPSVPVDVGCQMTLGDEGSECEGNDEVGSSGTEDKIEIAVSMSLPQDVSEDAEKRSFSSSDSSSSNSSPSCSDEKPPEDVNVTAEHLTAGVTNKDVTILMEVEIPSVGATASDIQVDINSKADNIEEIEVSLPDSQSVEVKAGVELPESHVSPVEVAVDMSSPSIPDIEKSSEEAENEVQVVMNEDGPEDPKDEPASSSNQEIKQKAKSKGFFSGFHFRLPRFRGRRSGKLDVTSKNDSPNISEGKISFNADEKRGSDGDMMEGISGFSKSSSELNVSRRRSDEGRDEFALDTRAPSVPDVSQREKDLKRAKKKSFTLPNMHLRLPRLGGKKSPKSPKSPTTAEASLPSMVEVDVPPPAATEASVVVNEKVNIVAACSPDISQPDAEDAIQADLKTELPSSDAVEVQLPTLNADEVETPNVEANISQGEGISSEVLSGKPQIDGVYIAVPAFVEAYSESEEGDLSVGDVAEPEVTGDLEFELEVEKLPAWGIDVTAPSVSNVQSDFALDQEADSAHEVANVSAGINVEVAEQPTRDDCEIELPDKIEDSLPSEHQTDAGIGLPCGIDIGINGDGEIACEMNSPQEIDNGLGGSLQVELQVVDEVKNKLPEVDGVTEGARATDGDGGCSENTFIDKEELMASGEIDCGNPIDVDVSVGLELSAGSGDTSLENQVQTVDSSIQADEKVTNEDDAQATSPDPKNSPIKHRFKLPNLHISLPKFSGLHSPKKKSKKSRMGVSTTAEVCSGGCENVDAVGDEEVCESLSAEVEEVVESKIPEPVPESELQVSLVNPEIDVKGDLEMRLSSLEDGDDAQTHDDMDNVKAKLDFDADEIPQELSFEMDGNSKANCQGLDLDDRTAAFNDFGVRLADFSFDLQEGSSNDKCDDDSDGCKDLGPSQEDPGSPVDLKWDDEICSSVQVSAPKYELSDIKGGLSLGVAVSVDGSIQSDLEEKMQLDEPDKPEGRLEMGDDGPEASLPEMPDLTAKSSNSTEQSDVEKSTPPEQPAPEVSLSVGAASSQRKQSVSSHSSAKSTSSHNSQTHTSENPKKKGGVMASLGLPKLHLKLPSPRSKSPNRKAAKTKQPEEELEGAPPCHPEEAKPSKKSGGGKKAKKGRWMPGKSPKRNHKKESPGKAVEGSISGGIPRTQDSADASLNIAGSADVSVNGHSSLELDPHPSTSSGPATSTPVKPSLSVNNSAQTPLTPCSLNIEQAIAVHSTPATPVATEPPTRKPFQVVVAIDFGTTFSGYAYSFTRDPDDIQIMRKWEGGDPGVTNMKTPTTLLLSPSGEFHSFGFTARDFYHDMDHNEALRWQYFDKFKLALHNDHNLNLETELTAANGHKVSAIQVFEHSLCFFREHAMEELCDQSNDGLFDPGEIRWVLTVPAIWKQPAKQFMREAAYRAGIATPSFPEQLLIALEPEAASVCIRKLRMRELVPERLSQRRKWSVDKPEKSNSQVAEKITHGTRYMVVDCGGGTVDITIHEVEEEAGTLKELHKASGGMHGSVCVDEEFEKLLIDIFTEDYIQEFKIKRPAGWVDLMIAFESRKRNANPYKNNPLNVSLPFSFIDYYKKYTQETSTVEDAIWNYRSRDVTWSAQGMLRFSPEGMQQLFRPAVANIISLVEGLLNEPQLKGVSYLFLAGGFAQSPLLQTQMRKKFASRLRVIIPRDVGLTILKGAVMFGLDPTAVRVRRSRLTYGVGVLNKFDPEKHPREKLVVKDKTEWCRDIFDTFVQADQSVALGDKVTRSYTPAKPSQKSIVINIYCTENDKVQFITDGGVQKCGTMHIDVSDSPSAGLTKRRELQLTMQYGDTEIKVSALDVPTGRCVKSNIDFLSK